MPSGLLLAVATLGYAGVILWLCVGLWRSRHTPCTAASRPAVSIIVAARNESAHIAACVQALQGQQYDGCLQVIVVDDRSSDDTGRIVAQLAAQGSPTGPPVRLLRAPDQTRYACPKKSALAAGIAVSTGELLLFTDADCTPPSTWVAHMVARFGHDVGLVAGFACTEPAARLRHRLLAVDNLGVSALAEGSIGMGAALSCTGRSLGYRRVVWDEVGGFDDIGHLIGGDDVYFLRLVAQQTAWAIRYCAAPEAVVVGPPGPTTWSDILAQKLRHASKASRYGGGARWLGVGVYGYHALLLYSLVAALMQLPAVGAGAQAFALLWGLRWLLDGVLLAAFAPRKRRDRVLLTFLPIVELLYLPYVLFLVPLGRTGRFRWKSSTPHTRH